jgi:hypothetical protein
LNADPAVVVVETDVKARELAAPGLMVNVELLTPVRPVEEAKSV